MKNEGFYRATYPLFRPQRDPIGYPDGMNSYAAYHGMRGGGDPLGLKTWAGIIWDGYWDLVDDAAGETHQQRRARERRENRAKMERVTAILRELTQLKYLAERENCDCLADELDEALENFTEDYLDARMLEEMADVFVETIKAMDDNVGRANRTFDRATFIGDFTHALRTGSLEMEAISGRDDIALLGEVLEDSGRAMDVLGDLADITESINREDGMDLALIVSKMLASEAGRHAGAAGGRAAAGLGPMLQFYLAGYRAAVDGVRGFQLKEGIENKLMNIRVGLESDSSCEGALGGWETISNVFGVR